MGKNFDSRPYGINDFWEWHQRGELTLSPAFQRRSVWSDKAKSFLIDTILRGLPVPKIYMRQQISVKAKKSIREIVDGQQRLRTIFSFLEDGFPVMKNHNDEYGGLYFSDLPEDAQNDFMKYELATDLILNSRDEIVLDIFARLNTYTVTLNKQELLNAKYFGLFKNTIYKLGFEFAKFYEKNGILTQKQIFRMSEAEFTSELVIAMLEGMQNKTNIEKFYIQYDDEFKKRNIAIKQFKETIDTISEIFGDELKVSLFNSKPLFYSLFCVIFHLKFGLPDYKFKKLDFNKKTIPKIKNAIEEIEDIIEDPKKYDKYQEFVDAIKIHTTNLNERKIRFEFILNTINENLK